MSKNTYKHLFGTVISRRYGRSLGVDMVKSKTCSFNCLFCQLGATAQTTVTPRSEPSAAEIISELTRWVSSDEECDIITLAGSGEPTLHSNFGEVLTYIKEHTPYPSLLLSNGSLFFKESVREQALNADIVKLSLHSWDQESFQRITRAESSLKLDQIIRGYRTFRQAYRGRIDLEVFVLPGINDHPEQMRRIARLASTFAPDSIFLNTAVRPPADCSVRQAQEATMRQLTELFGAAATTPVVTPEVSKLTYSDEAVVKLTARHPTSINQLEKQFDISYDDLSQRLKKLESEGVIALLLKDSQTFVSLPKQR